MEMPRPGEGHRKLERLVGNWTGEETMHESPWSPGGKMTGKVRNVRALDGFAVVQDYEQVQNGQVAFRGHGVFRFDAKSGKYQMNWFDSFGMPASLMEGTFEGDVLRMQMIIEQGHMRVRWDLTKPGEIDYLMEVSGDGKNWQPMLEGAYRKD